MLILELLLRSFFSDGGKHLPYLNYEIYSETRHLKLDFLIDFNKLFVSLVFYRYSKQLGWNTQHILVMSKINPSQGKLLIT